jgi:hypothetical protein
VHKHGCHLDLAGGIEGAHADVGVGEGLGGVVNLAQDLQNGKGMQAAGVQEVRSGVLWGELYWRLSRGHAGLGARQQWGPRAKAAKLPHEGARLLQHNTDVQLLMHVQDSNC